MKLYIDFITDAKGKTVYSSEDDIDKEILGLLQNIAAHYGGGGVVSSPFETTVDDSLSATDIAALYDAAEHIGERNVGHEIGWGADFYRDDEGRPTCYIRTRFDEIYCAVDSDGAIIDLNSDAETLVD